MSGTKDIMISRCLMAVGLLVLPSTASASPPPAPSGQHWVIEPRLSDEFNGDSLDLTKWQPFHPYFKGREKSEFEPSNVSVSGGYLRLTSSVLDPPHGAKWVGAACVSSKIPLAGPGYYEARLKSSQIRLSSSFWLQNLKSEIDVVEAFGEATDNPERKYEARATLHAFPNGWRSDIMLPHPVRITRPVTEWHTYGVWWRDSRSVWIYLDGEKVSSLTAPQDLTTPMWMFFDTELFSHVGVPTAADLRDPSRNTMLVDWVHAYRLAPN